jgi:toxin ParE1/3/4
MAYREGPAGSLRRHGPAVVFYVLDQLELLCLRLAELPERGHVPPELDRVGVTSYREVHLKPYRVIYELIRQDVFIHCVLDGRRDMQLLLARRLIR